MYLELVESNLDEHIHKKGNFNLTTDIKGWRTLYKIYK